MVLGFFFASACLLTAPAAESHRAESVHKWNWLNEADKARLLESIPANPVSGSQADRDDLAGVLKLQATRTPQDVAEAMDDEHFRLGMVTKALGTDFTKDHYPKAFALLKGAMEDESFLNWTLKKRYGRLRPYQAHPGEVKELFTVDESSYPSGHSSGSHVMATVLAKLFPDKKEALEARAEAVGRSRIVAGVHYPSDVEEGRKLADALTDALFANAAFQKDLADAMVEVSRRKSAQP